MFYGFWVEACADVQKSAHKDAFREASASAVETNATTEEEEEEAPGVVTPRRWVETGEWVKSRHVNYFGEVVFWAGSTLAATPSFGRQPLPWLCAGLGLAGIAKVMVEATQRLDNKHEDRYGSDPAWRAYAESTPCLWPKVGTLAKDAIRTSIILFLCWLFPFEYVYSNANFRAVKAFLTTNIFAM
jgi:steroid 5-alpha reductase family enzyme